MEDFFRDFRLFTLFHLLLEDIKQMGHTICKQRRGGKKSSIEENKGEENESKLN
jgi:hypothetical protein